ncbi:MAG: efflux RND transporter periplasmic adaptor subunit [Proteobacteria bacterium]|nr:efflux RND transporter periplasmic adaptor subunit [Pseudomonadota bacterium]
MKNSLILKIGISFFLIAFFLVAGWFLYKGNQAGSTDSSGNGDLTGPSKEEQRAVVNVSVLPLVRESIEETFVLPGTLEAWENLTLSLEQSGPIVWVGPDEGDRVKAGQPILMIDKSLLETQHARNQMEFEMARKQLERVEKLYEKQLVSQREMDVAQNAFDKASADLQQSSIAIEKSTLASPINGILEKTMVERGEYGNVGVPAAIVVQVDRLKVVVDVPEKDVSFVRVGQAAEVLTADLEVGAENPRKGKVFHVTYLADPSTRTYQAKIEIGNPEGLLRPGMIVRVRFSRRSLADTLVIPLYAVLDRGGEKEGFVEAGGQAFAREIVTGPVIGDRVVVLDGLEEGARLIVQGQHLVADGDPVAVVDDPQSAR